MGVAGAALMGPHTPIALGVRCDHCGSPERANCQDPAGAGREPHETRWIALQSVRSADLIRVRLRVSYPDALCAVGEIIILEAMEGQASIFFPLVSETTGKDLQNTGFYERYEIDFLNFISAR